MAIHMDRGNKGIWGRLHLTLEEHNVLIVDPDEATIDTVVNALQGSNLNLDTTNSIEEATGRLGHNYYDVVIFPYTGMPDNGTRLLRALKELSPDTQAIVTTTEYDEPLEERILGDGVYAILDVPIKPARLSLSVINAIKCTKSYRDGKTGLYTSTIFEDRLNEAINNLFGRRKDRDKFTTRRAVNPYISVLMVDFDNFKGINDTYGHFDGGDKVLKVVAGLLNKYKRQEDFAGRIGGDEYAIAFPGLDYNGAMQRAETIRSNVEGLRTLSRDGEEIRATVTIGVATLPYSGIPNTAEGLLDAADQALYHLKNNGLKNNVMGYNQLK